MTLTTISLTDVANLQLKGVPPMTEIVAAIITGILGILAGLLVGYKDEIVILFTSTKRSVHGKWRGSGTDVSVPPHVVYSKPRTYDIACELKQTGTLVTGVLTVSDSTRMDVMAFRGVLSGDEYIVGEYVNNDPNIKNRGQVLLQLRGDGDSLVGFFLSVRMLEPGLGFGSIELERC